MKSRLRRLGDADPLKSSRSPNDGRPSGRRSARGRLLRARHPPRAPSCRARESLVISSTRRLSRLRDRSAWVAGNPCLVHRSDTTRESHLSPSPTQFDFKDQTVVVTGGSRGIGRRICEVFADAGAQVHTCSRRGLEIPFENSSIEDEIVDVRDPAATEDWLARCAENRGGFDVLVNNAGGAPSVPSAEASTKLTNKILELNLNAPLILCQQAYPHLCSRPDGGVIVNIVSVSSTRPTPGSVAYGAAKGGLMNAT